MLSNIKYTFEINRESGKNREVTLLVPQNENLVQFGYEYLQREMGRMQKPQNVPMYKVYDAFALKGMQIIPQSCEGCKWDCPAQRDHMDCPGGCLHDSENCEVCEIVSSFDGDWEALPTGTSDTEDQQDQDC